jgi:excisionase family DNA binding protein
MRFLTAKEVSMLLQIPLARVYELARQSLIPSVRMGRQVRFNEEALRAWAANGGSLQPGAVRAEMQQDAA